MHRVVASFFGTGLVLGRLRASDAGSGTVGAGFALLISMWAGDRFGWRAQALGAVILAVASLWSTHRLASEVGDAGWIVIDEAAGAFVATISLLGWPAVVAFVVFRIADITKRPFPGVYQADAMTGSAGITADDLVAGLYGLAIGHLLRAAFF